MRHIVIRGLLSVIWFAAAIVAGSIVYGVFGVLFLLSVYREWKKEKDRKGED